MKLQMVKEKTLEEEINEYLDELIADSLGG